MISMKTRNILLLIIFLLLAAVIYLWNEKREEVKAHDVTYQVKFQADYSFITTVVMLNEIPDTFALYRNDFTESEFILFKNSIRNIALALSTKPADIYEIETFYKKDHRLSESIRDFSEFLFQIEQHAGELDAGVYAQLREVIPSYARKLEETFYRTSLQTIFEQSPKLFQEMTEELRRIARLDLEKSV